MGKCVHVRWSLIMWCSLLKQHIIGVGAQSDDLAAGTTPSPTESLLDYPDCAGYLPHASDGSCDEANNNAECGFDGGDCCHCTCVDGPSHSCGELGGGYDCQDPDVPDDCGSTPSPAARFGYPNCTGFIYNLHNGICNDDLNDADCDYDGGDCCRCTCRKNDPYSYDDNYWRDSCGSNGYDCQDPSAPNDCAIGPDSPMPNPTGRYSDYYYYGGRGWPAPIAGVATMGPSASDQHNIENDPETFSNDGNVDSARLFSGVQLAAVMILTLWGSLCFGTSIAAALWWVRHRYLGGECVFRVLIRQRLPRTAIIPEPANLTSTVAAPTTGQSKSADAGYLEEGKVAEAVRDSTRRDQASAAQEYGESAHVQADVDTSKCADDDDFEFETRRARAVDSGTVDTKAGTDLEDRVDEKEASDVGSRRRLRQLRD